MNKTGTFLISLDYELYWGVQENRTIDEYKERLINVNSVVNSLLLLFKAYEIHATWAIVGFMFAKDINELQKYLPSVEYYPNYSNVAVSSYRVIMDSKHDNYSECLFAKDTIKNIANSCFQEIGSHSFSHYFTKEDGQSVWEFGQDINSARRIAHDVAGIDLKSMVFPRNQCNDQYIKIISEKGFRAYRGLENDWIHNKISNFKLVRVFRLIDSFIPLTRVKPGVLLENNIINIPGTRFYRAYSHKLRIFEPLKMMRIKMQMKACAKKGYIFHLWWHPHNFGKNKEKNISNLSEVLKYYKKLEKKYGMKSFNMSEITENLRGV